MKTKLIALLGILALLVAIVPTAAFAKKGVDYKPVDYKPIDVGPELRTWEATPERIQGGFTGFTPGELNAMEAQALAAAASTPYTDCILDAKVWMSLNSYLGGYFFTTYYLVAETAGSELWVQNNDETETYNINWPAGDPRPTPEVTCEQAAYLLSEFDNNIYPTETDFFGTPDFHDGTYSLLEAWGYVPPGYYSNLDGRQVVLVSNVRDDNYYDSTYPNYIAGFYSPSLEAYFDRNVMSIDAYDWANRVGPDGGRPYLYEGVFAHEYQHLLHDDYDPDEDTWLNEGLSMFAEYLTGYVAGEDQYSTFQEFPENSLTVWGDQGGREIVADYGIVFLYQMYLYEKFGHEFIQAEFHNPLNGVSSVNDTLNTLGYTDTFAKLYHDFSIAVLIDSDVNDYQYGFELLDVGIDIGTADAPNPDAYDTPGAPPWGADYIHLGKNVSGTKRFMFNGIDFNPMAWTSDGETLYGGTGSLVDNMAIFETTGGGTLTFDTYWDIEPNWDFGFVQVSTDGGSSWTSLSNAYTTSTIDSNGHPNIAANLPGLTGFSSGWVNMSFDLSAYAGQDILVGFRYMTDWNTEEEGWYIDNVYVDSTLISDGSSTDGFRDLNRVLGITNEYTVQLVGQRKGEYMVMTVLSGDYISDWVDIHEMFRTYKDIVMVVTYDAPDGVSTYGPYTYEMYQGNRKGQFK